MFFTGEKDDGQGTTTNMKDKEQQSTMTRKCSTHATITRRIMRQGQGAGGPRVGTLRWWRTRRRRNQSPPVVQKTAINHSSHHHIQEPCHHDKKCNTHATTRTTPIMVRQRQVRGGGGGEILR